jgi:hypothetical protein
MSIIISKDGRNARKLEQTVIEQEEYLQQYIHANPEALPLDELKDNLRLLVLAREFNTASGLIDALGVDADGEIYVIEAKLDKNVDRRRIIAQALDYGAALWANPEDLIARMDRTEWRTRLSDFLGDDEEVIATHLTNVRQNAAAGRFWFVVLMDKLDDRLRELISFVNANSRFKVLGVELKFYRHENFEILIPNLYGTDRATDVFASTPATAPTARWDASSFLEAAAAQLEPAALVQMKELLAWWCEKKAASLGWGAKGPKGGFNPKFSQVDPNRSILSINAAGLMYLNFKHFFGRNDPGSAFAQRFGENLRRAGFCELPNDYLNAFPKLSISEWGPKVFEFERILDQSLRA